MKKRPLPPKTQSIVFLFIGVYGRDRRESSDTENHCSRKPAKDGCSCFCFKLPIPHHPKWESRQTEFPRKLGFLLPSVHLLRWYTSRRYLELPGNSETEKWGSKGGEPDLPPTLANWRNLTGSNPVQGQRRPCCAPIDHCCLDHTCRF